MRLTKNRNALRLWIRFSSPVMPIITSAKNSQKLTFRNVNGPLDMKWRASDIMACELEIRIAKP